jgi:hypothetical protein
VVTVDAPSRYAAAAVARPIVPGALKQQAPAPSQQTGDDRRAGLSGHPLPDLVMAGNAGDRT